MICCCLVGGDAALHNSSWCLLALLRPHYGHYHVPGIICLCRPCLHCSPCCSSSTGSGPVKHRAMRRYLLNVSFSSAPVCTQNRCNLLCLQHKRSSYANCRSARWSITCQTGQVRQCWCLGRLSSGMWFLAILSCVFGLK